MGGGHNKQSNKDPRLLTAWIVLHLIGGQIGLPLVLLTLICSHLRRLPTLYGLMTTWITASVICNLLFFTNHVGPREPRPDTDFCLIQGSLYAGIPLMGSLAAFALVYEGWATVTGQEITYGKRGLRMRTALLLVLPWIGLVLAASPVFAIGYANPKFVKPRKTMFHCEVKVKHLHTVTASAQTIVLIVTVIFGVKIAILLRRSWRQFKSRVSDSSRPESRIYTPYLAIRIAVFALYVFLSVALSLMCAVIMGPSPWSDVIFAAIPLVVFVVFGTQSDIIRIWIGLLPKFIKPRALQQWATRSSRNSPPSDPSLDYPVRRSAFDPDQLPSTPPNMYDVWKTKYLDPGSGSGPRRPRQVHTLDNRRWNARSWDSYDSDRWMTEKPLPELPYGEV